MNNIRNLKERRKIWIDCLLGEDEHSIKNQLYQFSWDLNSYRIINESRRYTPHTESGDVKLNAMLHNLLDRSFLEGSLLKIRRLTDNYSLYSISKSKKKNEDVYSLVSLLNDLIKHSEYLKRENFFIVENLEYDISKIEKRHDEFTKEQILKGSGFYWVPKECDSSPSIERHNSIDLLCNIGDRERSKTDEVESSIFDLFIKAINLKVEQVKLYVDKIIAHPSTPESRSKLNKEFSISDIVNIYITLANVANFIQLFILNKGNTFNLFSPEPHFNFLEYLEEPFIQKENNSELFKKWKEYQDQYNKSDVFQSNDFKTSNDYLNKIFE